MNQVYIDDEKHGGEAVVAHAQEQVAVHVHDALLVVLESEVDEAEHQAHRLHILEK